MLAVGGGEMGGGGEEDESSVCLGEKGGREGRSSMLSCVKGRDKASSRPMEGPFIALSVQQAKDKFFRERMYAP